MILYVTPARQSYPPGSTFSLEQYRQQMSFGYLQADWKATPKLTLNLGVRYEFATPQYEAANRLSNFDPTTNTLVPATDGSGRNRTGIDPDRNEKGVSSYDQTFNNTTLVAWELPFGKGQRIGSSRHRATDALLGGWRATVINTMTSGLPGTLRYNPVARQAIGGVGGSIRPNITGASLYSEPRE